MWVGYTTVYNKDRYYETPCIYTSRSIFLFVMANDTCCFADMPVHMLSLYLSYYCSSKYKSVLYGVTIHLIQYTRSLKV